MASLFRSLEDVEVAGKRVLLRGDLNVPVQDGAVRDATRLERLAETIRELVAKKAKVIVLSHFGRPKGKVEPSMSLRPVAAVLGKIIGQPVKFCDDLVGAKAQAAVKELLPGQVLILENTRFYPGEEKNDKAFAAQLAALGDVFVSDAFSVAHRAHASTEGIAHFIPSCAGREMQAEIETLTLALEKPEHPLIAIVGGSKISTKLDLLTNLTRKVDILVLGGGMANTFLAAQGKAMGRSLFEPDMLETARTIMAESEGAGCRMLLPSDVVVAREFKEHAETQVVAVDAIPADCMALDVGPETVRRIEEAIAASKTLVWNGPLGAFETAPFEEATVAVAKTIARLTAAKKLVSIAGGGDTVAAVNVAGVANDLSYISMAGGAFLEWLEGRKLPGVEILRKEAPKSKAVG
jgi:phosphoglycerate kinase